MYVYIYNIIYVYIYAHIHIPEYVHIYRYVCREISGFRVLGLVGFVGFNAWGFGLLWFEGQGLRILGPNSIVDKVRIKPNLSAFYVTIRV